MIVRNTGIYFPRFDRQLQFLFISSIFLSVSFHSKAQEPQPIEIRRVVIDLELTQTIGSSMKTKEKDEVIRRGSFETIFGRDFQSQSNFYPHVLKEYIEEAFVQQSFNVRGYGHIFKELHKSEYPRYSIGFVVNDLFFNYFAQFGSTKPNQFHSEMDIRVQLLDLNSELLLVDKVVQTKFFSEKPGFASGAPNTTDFSNYFEGAFAKLVEDLLADPEIKAILYEEKKPAAPQFDEELRLSMAGAPERTPIKAAMAATVTIRNGAGHGSGAIISPDGLILTCHHNIHAAEEVQIIFSNGIRTTATVLRKDPEYDLALLKLKDIEAKPLYLSGNADPEPGDEAWVIGTPASTELGQSVSRGVVSGNRVINDKFYIQTDASVNPGNSGGPMLKADGRIIGIVNAKVVGSGMEGLGFAIPTATIIDRLKIVLD